MTILSRVLELGALGVRSPGCADSAFLAADFIAFAGTASWSELEIRGFKSPRNPGRRRGMAMSARKGAQAFLSSFNRWCSPPLHCLRSATNPSVGTSPA